jgi:hypothetical protein
MLFKLTRAAFKKNLNIQLEYNESLLAVKSSLPFPSDLPDGKILIQVERIAVTGSDKVYMAEDLRRINRNQLLAKPKSLGNGDYLVYCLPGDETAAAQLILAQIQLDTEKEYKRISGIRNAISQGYLLLDPRERVKIQMAKKIDILPPLIVFADLVGDSHDWTL